jgi:membrane protein
MKLQMKCASNIVKSIESWKIVVFLRKTILEFTADNGTLLPAAISYYLILSMFPFLLATISIASFFVDLPSLQEHIFQAFQYLIPVSQDFITNTINIVIGERGAVSIVSIILLILGCMGFFSAVRKSLNTAWGIHKSKSFMRAGLINFAMIFGTMLLLFVTYCITVLLNISAIILGSVIDQPITNLVLLHILMVIGDVFLAFVVFLIIYKFIPERPVRWRDIWTGALGAAVCFEVVTILFIVYLNIFNPYNLVYGSIGTIIALLIWTYLAALIFLFFAKISAIKLGTKTK